MIRHFFLLLLTVWFCTPAKADPSVCPDGTYRATIEEAHHTPGPILLIPDVVKNPDTPEERLEWNYLSNVPEDDNTVHCYPTKSNKIKTDVLLPKGIKKCTFYKHNIWCE
jgi:hypothetical protein